MRTPLPNRDGNVYQLSNRRDQEVKIENEKM